MAVDNDDRYHPPEENYRTFIFYTSEPGEPVRPATVTLDFDLYPAIGEQLSVWQSAWNNELRGRERPAATFDHPLAALWPRKTSPSEVAALSATGVFTVGDVLARPNTELQDKPRVDKKVREYVEGLQILPEMRVMAATFGGRAEVIPVEREAEVQQAVSQALDTLSTDDRQSRSATMIREFAGITSGRVPTKNELGQAYGVSSKTVSDRIGHGLRLLRHPKRSKALKGNIPLEAQSVGRQLLGWVLVKDMPSDLGKRSIEIPRELHQALYTFTQPQPREGVPVSLLDLVREDPKRLYDEQKEALKGLMQATIDAPLEEVSGKNPSWFDEVDTGDLGDLGKALIEALRGRPTDLKAGTPVETENTPDYTLWRGPRAVQELPTQPQELEIPKELEGEAEFRTRLDNFLADDGVKQSTREYGIRELGRLLDKLYPDKSKTN